MLDDGTSDRQAPPRFHRPRCLYRVRVAHCQRSRVGDGVSADVTFIADPDSDGFTVDICGPTDGRGFYDVYGYVDLFSKTMVVHGKTFAIPATVTDRESCEAWATPIVQANR